jgi:hypothetical protein
MRWLSRVVREAVRRGRAAERIGQVPAGPRAGLFGQDPVKFVQTPGLLLVIYENAPTRQIFLDGRALPRDPNPSWMGYSVGHWEGDTLVVETRGFRDDLWADTWGSPMSDAAKMIEKFTRKNFGSMDIEVTIDDPKVYTKPFTVKLTDNLEPDTELVDEFCLEGEKDYERLQRSRGK